MSKKTIAGCRCGLDPDMKSLRCIMDPGMKGYCVQAKILESLGCKKKDCCYWKPRFRPLKRRRK